MLLRQASPSGQFLSIWAHYWLRCLFFFRTSRQKNDWTGASIKPGQGFFHGLFLRGVHFRLVFAATALEYTFSPDFFRDFTDSSQKHPFWSFSPRIKAMDRPMLGHCLLSIRFQWDQVQYPRRYPEERERRAAAEHKTGGEPKVPDPRGYGGGPANGGRGQDSIAIRIRLLSRQMSCRPRGKVILKEHRIPSGVETAEHSAASSHCLHRSGGSLSRI